MVLKSAIQRKRRDASSGFTLVEILIAMVIAGIVGVSLYVGLAQTFNSLQSARHRLRATQILTEKLEVIRLYNWDQINDPAYVPSTFTEYYHAGTNASGIVYTGSITITDASNVPSAYTNTMRKVVVQLNWTNGNIAQQESMETLVSEHGIQNYIY